MSTALSLFDLTLPERPDPASLRTGPGLWLSAPEVPERPPAPWFPNADHQAVYETFCDKRTQTRPSQWIAAIPNLTLKGDSWFGFTEQGQPILESYHGSENERRKVVGDPSPKTLSEQATLVEDPGLILFGLWGGGYFHWLCDILPRLGLIRQAGLEDLPLYVPPLKPFQRQTLNALGVMGQVREFPQDTVRLSLGLLVAPPSSFSYVSQQAAHWLRDTLAPALKAPPSPRPNRRYYLTRGEGAVNGRAVDNEAALIQALSAYGFTALDCGSLPIQAQAKALSQADIIVAPNGGALANIAFAPVSAKVLELASQAHINGYVSFLSGHLGQKRGTLIFPTDEETGTITVPPSYCLKALEALLAA